MAPKPKSSNAGNLDMPKRSWKVFPLSEKKKALNKERKIYTEVNHKNESSICEIVKREREISVSFAIPSQTAKVMTTEHGKRLVDRKKALNLYTKIF